MQDYNLGPSVSVEAVGDKYDQTSTYAVGDYCIKDDKLYVCNTAIETAEAWNASHWTDTTIADVLQTIPSVVDNLTTNDGAKALSAAQGKALNDKVTNGYRGIAYLVGTINGSTTIPAGSFVYVNNNGNGVADGLYTANEAIGAYYQITTSRVTAVPDGGGLNALNGNIATFGFSSLHQEQTITSSYATYNLGTGRKFSDWDMLNIVAYRGNWVLGSTMVTRASFASVTGVQIISKWNETDIECDVKYTSDTSFDAKFISTDTGTIKVRIYAMKLAV